MERRLRLGSAQAEGGPTPEAIKKQRAWSRDGAKRGRSNASAKAAAAEAGPAGGPSKPGSSRASASKQARLRAQRKRNVQLQPKLIVPKAQRPHAFKPRAADAQPVPPAGCPTSARKLGDVDANYEHYRCTLENVLRIRTGAAFGQKWPIAQACSQLVSSLHAQRRCEVCHRSCIGTPHLHRPPKQGSEKLPAGQLLNNTAAHTLKVRKHSGRHGQTLRAILCGHCHNEFVTARAASDGTRATKLTDLPAAGPQRHPGFAPANLPPLTLSESMFLARAHVRVAVHQLRQGGLLYKGNCLFLAKLDFVCVNDGFLSAAELPLVAVRYGEVEIGEVKHQDFLVRPEVLQAWWGHKCSTMPELFHGLCPAVAGSEWCGFKLVDNAKLQGWHGLKVGGATEVVNIVQGVCGAQMQVGATVAAGAGGAAAAATVAEAASAGCR